MLECIAFGLKVLKCLQDWIRQGGDRAWLLVKQFGNPTVAIYGRFLFDMR